MHQIYPCICTPCTGCVTTPSCPSGDCLRVASFPVDPETSVLPCNHTGTVDIAAESDLSICTGTLVWELISWDTTAFSGVTISDAGVITFTSTSAAEVRKYYEFVGRVFCTGTLLSQFFTILVPIKDGCYGKVCPSGQVCDPCSPTQCIASPDVELS